MRISSFLLIVLLHSMLIPAGSSEADQTERLKFSVLSYNVHLLPDLALKVAGKRGESEYRVGAIVERIAGYDIVGLNEVFDKDLSRELIRSLQSEGDKAFFVAKGPKRSGRHLIGSGLVLASRFPIGETHRIIYAKASRFVTSEFKADGFAAKGALHATLHINEHSAVFIDCFLTHLESRSSKARDQQIEEFAAFVEKHSAPERPTLILGDFNVEADEPPGGTTNSKSQYQRLYSALDLSGRALSDLGLLCPPDNRDTSNALAEGGGRRIDYMFISQSRSRDRVDLRPLNVSVMPMLDEKVPEGSLSDHLAVACRAEVKYRRK